MRTHDDEAWSRRQNELIDARIESANELARRGETDPVAFLDARDRRRSDPESR